MTTWHAPEQLGLPDEARHVGPAAARLRRILGLLLLLTGSIWLGLSLTGHIVEVPLPIDWVKDLVVAWMA